jgi:hypothetical protein
VPLTARGAEQSSGGAAVRRTSDQPQREVSPLAMWQARPFEWPGDPVTPLELYGAQVAPDMNGWWVYAFADRPGSRWSDGKVWYAGQTDHFWSRWRDHYYKYGERFTAAVKWVIPVDNEAVAWIVESTLIHFYQPECNTRGRLEDLQRKIARISSGDLRMYQQAAAGTLTQVKQAR